MKDTFYENLQTCCAKKLITPGKLCDKLGYSRSMVKKWKEGATPRDSTLTRLSMELGVSVDDLLPNPLMERAATHLIVNKPIVSGKTVPANNIIKEVDAETMGKIINSVLRMNSEQLKSLDKYIAFLLSQEEQ